MRECIRTFLEYFANGLFECATHGFVAFFAARDCELPVTKRSAVWKSDGLLVQIIAAQNPIWENMLVIERCVIGTNSANETAFAFDDV
jgi:hypothetical protein